MNKFIVVSFIEKVPFIFANATWPLHVTILRPFSFNGDTSDLIEILEICCLRTNKIKTIGKTKEMFGVNNDVPVTELKKNHRTSDSVGQNPRTICPIDKI
jgi:hypothetical protein